MKKPRVPSRTVHTPPEGVRPLHGRDLERATGGGKLPPHDALTAAWISWD